MTLGELFGLEAKLPEGLSRLPISGLAADSRESFEQACRWVATGTL